MTQAHWWIGLVVSICGALVGQSEVLPEPWRHVVTIVFVAGTAANAYMLQPKEKDPK